MTDDDIQLIHSPLTQTYSADGHTLQIEIYRGAGSLWILEIVDELGTSSIWEAQFETDTAALAAAFLAIEEEGIKLPIFVEVTVETTGTMLMGSEIGAALTTLEPLGIDMIGLNCATGPAEMSEHLRQLSKFSTVPIMVMPNAGLPELTADGARYPLGPEELAIAHEQFVKEFGLSLVGGCCGTTPAHLKAVVDRVGGMKLSPRKPEHDAGVASLYQHVPFNQDSAFLAIGERTNANGSKAFREAMLEGRWDDCVDIARQQVQIGRAHV